MDYFTSLALYDSLFWLQTNSTDKERLLSLNIYYVGCPPYPALI